jgi:hypothetical protein
MQKGILGTVQAGFPAWQLLRLAWGAFRVNAKYRRESQAAYCFVDFRFGLLRAEKRVNPE